MCSMLGVLLLPLSGRLALSRNKANAFFSMWCCCDRDLECPRNLPRPRLLRGISCPGTTGDRLNLLCAKPAIFSLGTVDTLSK